MEYDHDDPPPRAVTSNEYWHIFRLTFPTQLFWLAVYGLIVLLVYLIVGLRLSNAAPICVNKQDIYRLALADMQGTGPQKWEELVAEGNCANVPAQYLWTMDTYSSPEFTHVATYLAFGHQVYGLTTTLPKNVWSIRYDEEWEKRPPHVRKWFQSLMRPDNPFISCCGEADGYEADLFEQDGENFVAIITGQGPEIAGKPYIAEGTRMRVPRTKMKWDAGNPTGHGILFVGTDGTVFCYVTPALL
jgi:hypothetical protein